MLEAIVDKDPVIARITNGDFPVYSGCDVAIEASDYNSIDMTVETIPGTAVSRLFISDETNEIFAHLYSQKKDSEGFSSEFLFKLVDGKWVVAENA